MESRIKVGIRVRPMMANELELGAMNSLKVDKEQQLISHASSKKAFADFDWVFGQSDNHTEIYESMCRPLIETIFDGFNATFFACEISFLPIIFCDICSYIVFFAFFTQHNDTTRWANWKRENVYNGNS
jgi:hypothetical protein